MNLSVILKALPVAQAAGKASLSEATAKVAISFVGAIVDGSQEEVRATAAKRTSGNAAGLTNEEMREMAVRIKKNGGGTQARGAEAVAALTETAKVDRSVIEHAATAIAKANRLENIPIKTLAEKFAKLGNQPSKSSAELNEEEGYLLPGQYQSIRALEKSGKLKEAAVLAQTLYAAELQSRTDDISKSRNFILRGAQVHKDVTESIEDSARQIGRPSAGKLEKIADIDERIKDARERRVDAMAKSGSGSGSGLTDSVKQLDQLIAALAKQRAELVEALSRDRQLAESARTNTRAVQEEIKASQLAEEEEDAKKSAAANRKNALEERTSRAIPKSRMAVHGKGSGIQRAETEGLRSGIEVACCHCKAEVSKPGTAAAQEERTETDGKAGRTFGTPDASSQIDPLLTLRQETDGVRAQTAALEAQNAVHGKLKSEIRELNILQLERQLQDLEATESVIPGYVEALSQRIDAERKLLNATRGTEGIEAADKAQTQRDAKSGKLSDDLNGVFREGFNGLLQGDDKALDKMGQSLKKKIVSSISDALYDKSLKPAVEGFSKWLTNSLSGIFSGSGSGSSGGGGNGDSGGSGGNWLGSLVNGVMSFFVKSANGNVFSSPGLHAYANSVVGKPTFFPFANGIGLMGEAGPEAIMPLRRGSDGRLGVSAQGASGGGALHYAPSTVFHIDSRSDRGAVMADLDRALQANNQGQMEQLKRMRVVPQ
ncbi:phage tail length tape measure family protein [Variovorax boronicumulans]|uniref:phage tail length tape measure family protein n=1 Tax=Variovorax boronicumulans TaxID=436515 RepID=UPI0012E685B3|nr:phage tail length tape measure family protein [Variovorax boronicumulans]GER20691.1 phage tail tape measure protein [Variovorax boronicumulans]